MQEKISLKEAEKKAFKTSFDDGLWDILIGSFFLEFAIAPLISASLGDFWSSVVFLPFWGFDYRTQFFSNRLKETGMGKTSFNK
jgi:hypothetical protein